MIFSLSEGCFLSINCRCQRYSMHCVLIIPVDEEWKYVRFPFFGRDYLSFWEGNSFNDVNGFSVITFAQKLSWSKAEDEGVRVRV